MRARWRVAGVISRCRCRAGWPVVSGDWKRRVARESLGDQTEYRRARRPTQPALPFDGFQWVETALTIPIFYETSFSSCSSNTLRLLILKRCTLQLLSKLVIVPSPLLPLLQPIRSRWFSNFYLSALCNWSRNMWSSFDSACDMVSPGTASNIEKITWSVGRLSALVGAKGCLLVNHPLNPTIIQQINFLNKIENDLSQVNLVTIASLRNMFFNIFLLKQRPWILQLWSRGARRER